MIDADLEGTLTAPKLAVFEARKLGKNKLLHQATIDVPERSNSPEAIEIEFLNLRIKGTVLLLSSETTPNDNEDVLQEADLRTQTVLSL